jgi:tetratricopeptide (TPR) repeat protein
MARLYIKLKDFDKAIKYYNEAISLEKDPTQKALDLYELGTVELSQNRYQSARGDAREAIKLQPKNGKLYLLIGSIYAASAKTFGDNDFDKSMVFVLAVDYFKKAKAVDPSVAEEANKNISIYKKYFPNKENAFFQGYNAGDTYRVGGWINETTKIQFR